MHHVWLDAQQCLPFAQLVAGQPAYRFLQCQLLKRRFMKTVDKKKDILEFIRVALLRPEQIDGLLPQITQSLISRNEGVADEERVKKIAKERILSDEHLEQFVSLVEETFSHEEVKRLIQFYKDSAVDKYFRKGAIFAAVYSSFKEVVQSVLQPL